MSKLVQFLKRTLGLVICLSILGAGLVTAIVPWAIPHGGTYIGTTDWLPRLTEGVNEDAITQAEGAKETKVKYVFKGGKVTAYYDGKKVAECEYVIYKGRFLPYTQEQFEYMKDVYYHGSSAFDDVVESWDDAAKLNGLRMHYRRVGGHTFTLYCVTDIVFCAIGFLIALVGGVGTIASLKLRSNEKKKSA